MVSFFCLIISFVPKHISGFEDFSPNLLIISLFYWCMYVPGSIPYIAIFFFGIVYDSLTTTVFGLTSMLLILYVAFLLPQLKIFLKQSFFAVCFAFAISYSIYQFLDWSFVSLINFELVNIIPLLVQTAITAFIYPIMHLLFNFLYARLK